jgi:hypothetical protein
MVKMGAQQLSGQVRADKEYSLSRTKTTVFENDHLAAMTHEKLPACMVERKAVPYGLKKKPLELAWTTMSGSA